MLIKRQKFCYLFLLFLYINFAYSQCSDVNACNFNQNDTSNESCEYFDYEIGDLLFDCYLNFSGPSSCESPFLDPGTYVLELSGTFCYGSCSSGSTVDAAYSFGGDISPINNMFSWNEYCPQDSPPCFPFRPVPDEYNPENVYYYPFSSSGGVEILYGIADECCWWDNIGGLNVRIYSNISCNSCSGAIDGSGYVIDNDLNENSICDFNETQGCTNPEACNFNP